MMQNIESQVWVSKEQFDATITQFLIQREVELELDIKNGKIGIGFHRQALRYVKSLMARHGRDELWNWKEKS